MRKNKKKKQALASFGLIVMCFVMGVVGGTLASAGGKGDGTLIGMLLDLICFAVVLWVQMIIHEGGHMIFGLWTGYRFLSFRIGSIMIIKYPEGFAVKKFSIAGTGGQCLLIPPDMDDEDPPVFLYMMGGVILNLFLSGIALAVVIFLKPVIGRELLIIFTIIGVVFGLANGIPMSTAMVTNDGYNAWALRKDKEARRAFLLQLKINEQQHLGIRLKDMPDEWFEISENWDLHNIIYTAIAVFRENRLMDALKFEEAQEYIQELLTEKYSIIGLYERLLMLDDVYIKLLRDPDAVALDALQEKNYKKIFRQMKDYPGIIRTQYAFAVIKEKNLEKAKRLQAQFEKIAKRYPAKADLAVESELMQLVKYKE